MITTSKRTFAFTLIELVIAISILSLLLVVGYGSVSQISRGKRILDDNRDGVLVAQAVLRKMVRELASTTKGQGILLKSGTNKGPNLLASPPAQLNAGTVITFLTPNTFASGKKSARLQSELTQVSYSIARDYDQTKPNLYQLLRDEMPYLADYVQAKKARIVFPVATNVRSLRFRFYSEPLKKWFNRWGDTPATRGPLPNLIELHFVLETPLGRKYEVKTSVPVIAN